MLFQSLKRCVTILGLINIVDNVFHHKTNYIVEVLTNNVVRSFQINMLVYILIRIFPVLGPFMLGHFKASVTTSYSQVQSALMCLKSLLPQKYRSLHFSTSLRSVCYIVLSGKWLKVNIL